MSNQSLLTQEKIACQKLKNGEFAEAIKIYDELIQNDPNDQYLFCNKGFCLENLKLYDKAIESYRTAIELNNEEKCYLYIFCLERLGCIFLGKNDYDNAIPIYRELINSNSAYTDITSNLLNLSFCLKKLDMNDDALPVYEELVKLHPSNNTFSTLLAICLIDTGKFERAFEIMCKTVDNKKSSKNNSGTTLLYSAYALYVTGDTSRGNRLLSDAYRLATKTKNDEVINEAKKYLEEFAIDADLLKKFGLEI